MANYNIGPKIGIEGEKEFRTQISRINKEYSAMESYTKAVSTAMAQQGKSQELLASKSNSLRQQLNLQQQKFRELSDALEKAKASYDENSQEVLRFEGAILDVKNTTAALQRELDATDDELRRMAAGIEDVGDAAEVADDKVLSFGDMLKAGIASGAILNGLERAGELIVEVGAQSIEAAAEVKAANSQFRQTFGDLESTATSALRSISDETGIAVTRLQGGYTALYAFTKSVGGDQETALSIAQRALRAAADSAAYYDRSMEDATETLQSFLKGNYENDAALGIAATETTRNAKANELYAKSFKELTEAQKVDTLLSMVEAGNKASGAMGQAAREADSWANVTGELANVWQRLLANTGAQALEALTPILAGINEQLNQLMAPRPVNELNAGIDAFRAGLQNANDAITDTNTRIGAQADMAERYAERLQRLEEAGLDTADSQREYAQTVELLNSVMPELGLTIDETTGLVTEQTDAILKNISSLQAQARQQAKMSYYKDVYEEYLSVQERRYAAEMELIKLQEQEAPLLQQVADAQAAYNAALSGTEEEQTAARNALLLANADLQRNRLHQEELTGSIEELDATIAENEALLLDAAEGHEALAGAAGDSAGAVDDISVSYEELKNAARASIDSQIGLFDELADANKWSAEKIIENWQKQQKAFSNYEDNLKKAVELGLDETLIAQLSDGSQQSMQILDALVNDVDISVDEINAEFGRVDESKEALSGTMGEIRGIVDGTFNDIAEAMEASGKDIIDGAILGINSNKKRFTAALAGVAKEAQNDGWNQAWMRHSPSRWMMAASDDIVDGGVIQIERRAPDMARAMRDMAQAGQNAYLQEQLDYAAQYPNMVAGAPGYGGGTTTNNRSVAYGGISININTQPGQDAQSIADAVLQELTVRLGQEEAAF